MKRFLVAFILLIRAAHAEALGRLFFTPEQRAFLDKLHQTHGRILLQGKSDGASGSVEAKNGGRTVWIGGVPRHIPPGRRK